MYRSFPQMWEGWTKNLALLFPKPRRLALWRALEFVAILAMLTFAIVSLTKGDMITFLVAAAVTLQWLYLFGRRIARAHFDGLSNTLAFFGLPLFAVLLVNSSISHEKGTVRWKGREYSGLRNVQPADEAPVAAGNTSAH
jgi:hypothetical protein